MNNKRIRPSDPALSLSVSLFIIIRGVRKSIFTSTTRIVESITIPSSLMSRRAYGSLWKGPKPVRASTYYAVMWSSWFSCGTKPCSFNLSFSKEKLKFNIDDPYVHTFMVVTIKLQIYLLGYLFSIHLFLNYY